MSSSNDSIIDLTREEPTATLNNSVIEIIDSTTDENGDSSSISQTFHDNATRTTRTTRTPRRRVSTRPTRDLDTNRRTARSEFESVLRGTNRNSNTTRPAFPIPRVHHRRVRLDGIMEAVLGDNLRLLQSLNQFNSNMLANYDINDDYPPTRSNLNNKAINSLATIKAGSEFEEIIDLTAATPKPSGFTIIKKKKDNPSIEVGESCVVCLCEFESGQNCIIFPCRHAFHKSCAKRWLKENNSCPICREKAVK